MVKPEAIFYDGELVFLSHIHPRVLSRYDAQLAEVAWRRVEDGIEFGRTLPDGVRFGASVRKKSEAAVALRIWIEDGTPNTLRTVKMQTCAYLLHAAGPLAGSILVLLVGVTMAVPCRSAADHYRELLSGAPAR